MIIVLKPDVTKKQFDHVIERIKALGLKPMVSKGTERTIIGVIGPEDALRTQPLEVIPGVEKVMPVLKPYKLVSREFKPEPSIIDVGGGVTIGGKELVVMAGPCSVENRDMLMETAKAVKHAGAQVLRGGAFKPRTSPYAFQGMGEQGLKILAEARAETGLPIVSEALDPESLAFVYKYADVIQIGARNMQNFALLKEAGKLDKPVLLKRGLSATVDEWLQSAEYLLSEGNRRVILCERGIRTFSSHTRNTLDLNAVPVAQKLSHLPVLVDPSHGTGLRDKVAPLAKASAAVGAHGVIIEVHDRPAEALCDGPQAMPPAEFAALVVTLKALGGVLGYTM